MPTPEVTRIDRSKAPPDEHKLAEVIPFPAQKRPPLSELTERMRDRKTVILKKEELEKNYVQTDKKTYRAKETQIIPINRNRPEINPPIYVEPGLEVGKDAMYINTLVSYQQATPDGRIQLLKGMVDILSDQTASEKGRAICQAFLENIKNKKIELDEKRYNKIFSYLAKVSKEGHWVTREKTKKIIPEPTQITCLETGGDKTQTEYKPNLFPDEESTPVPEQTRKQRRPLPEQATTEEAGKAVLNNKEKDAALALRMPEDSFRAVKDIYEMIFPLVSQLPDGDPMKEKLIGSKGLVDFTWDEFVDNVEKPVQGFWGKLKYRFAGGKKELPFLRLERLDKAWTMLKAQAGKKQVE